MAIVQKNSPGLRQIILDTETTGLDPAAGHRIIEIAAIEMINRRFTGKALHYYIHPEREIDKEAQKVHGITEKFLEDKPKFQEIADEVFEFLTGSELIIHNAPFDIGFLDHEFQRLSRFPKIMECCTVVDTLLLARKKHRGQKNNLDALCKRYQIDNSHRDLHGALIDVRLLGDVYLAMTGGQLSLLDRLELSSKEPMVASKPSSSKDVFPVSQRKPLKIVHASPEEVAADEGYWEET